MRVNPSKRNNLKFAAAFLIVGAAVLIMLPDLVTYLAGLWHLGIIVLFILLLAIALAIVIINLKKSRLLQQNINDACEQSLGEHIALRKDLSSNNNQPPTNSTAQPSYQHSEKTNPAIKKHNVRPDHGS